MSKCFIGIDAGGTMTKAALFDLQGRELACARSSNVMICSHPGWTERDPERMWLAAASAIRQVLAESGIPPGDVAAVSVSGYGSGLYLIDSEGRAVRPGIVSTDTRALSMLDEWRASGLSQQIEPLIRQSVWPGQSLMLLAWLKRHEPDVLSRTHRISFCKDFLRTQLCGDMSTDPTDAGSAGLLNMQTGNYALDAMDLAGLGDLIPKLPEIGPSDEVVGGISATAAAMTGLLEGTPVVRGTVDMSATALASDITQPQQMSVVAGTWSIATTLHEQPRFSRVPMLQFPYPLGGYLAVQGSPTSASNLEWVVQTLLTHGGTLAEQLNGDIYDTVNEAVARRLGQPSDTLFLPYLFGGPSGAPAGFVGMNVENNFDDLMLAVFEGIVFAHKADIDETQTGEDAAPVELIRLSGGATRSTYWSELFADILELPVEVPSGSEFGALGTAICAAHAVGAYPRLADAVAAMTGISRRHEVNSERGAVHRAKFPRFQSVAQALATAWNEGAVHA